MTKVLVTGATGFIGKACLNALAGKDLEIHAISRKDLSINNQHPEVTWHVVDIMNQTAVTELMKLIAPSYLLHLAWIVDHQIFWTTEKNIDYIGASVHLYKQFSLQGGKKAVFVGTCAEYDRQYTDCEEDITPLKPTTLYGLSKKQTYELLCQLKSNQQNYADFSWVRLFNIYGPHEHIDRLIPYIFLSYLKKQIPLLNNPNAIRDHIYVENIATLLVYLLENETPMVINFGSGYISSLGDIAYYIHQKYFKDQPPPIHKVQQDLNIIDKLVPSLTRLKKINIPLLVPFETSLDQTYDWLLNNKGL